MIEPWCGGVRQAQRAEIATARQSGPPETGRGPVAIFDVDKMELDEYIENNREFDPAASRRVAYRGEFIVRT